MRRLTPQLYLATYSAVLTLAFALTFYFGFIRPVHGASRITDFDRIRVHRIDIIEQSRKISPVPSTHGDPISARSLDAR
jgi:hypothetical protein